MVYEVVDPVTRILAIDPGITTGFSIWTPQPLDRKSWEVKFDPKNDLHNDYLQVLVECLPGIIVCESFDHRQRDKIDYTPVELIGLTKWYASRRDILLFLQPASYGKGFFDNNKLKHLKLYAPGNPHAMDALRHLLQFRMKHGLFDMNLLK